MQLRRAKVSRMTQPSTPDGARMHVAAMTGYGQKIDRASTLAAGFQAHLTKPVVVEQLREMLRDARLR